MATILNINQDCRWNISKIFPEICYISKVVSRYFGRKYDFEPVWNLETRSRAIIINDDLYYFSKFQARYVKYDKGMISNISNIVDYDHLQRYFYYLDNELFYVGYNFAIDEKVPIKCNYFNISNINICDGKIVKRTMEEIFEYGLESICIMNEELINIKTASRRPAKLENCMTGRKYLFIHPKKLTNCFIENGMSFYVPSNLNNWRYIRPVKAILQSQKEAFSEKNIWFLVLFGYKMVYLRTVLPNNNVKFISWREISMAKIMKDSVLEKVHAARSISYNMKSYNRQ